MFRKILIILSLLVICSLFSSYFYFAGKYTVANEADLRCNDIRVVFKDSPGQKFISEESLKELVRPHVEGKIIKETDTGMIEGLVSETGVISHAEVYVCHPSVLVVEVEQRNPVVRIEAGALSCYADTSGYLIPLIDNITLDLPIICGNVPVTAKSGIRGFPESGHEWLRHTLTFTETVRKNSYWSAEIEQIWVNSDTDMVVYTRSMPEKFIFGQIGDRQDIREKLDKMAGYYRTIRPEALQNGRHYQTVNLKYKDQIICKQI